MWAPVGARAEGRTAAVGPDRQHGPSARLPSSVAHHGARGTCLDRMPVGTGGRCVEIDAGANQGLRQHGGGSGRSRGADAGTGAERLVTDELVPARAPWSG